MLTESKMHINLKLEALKNEAAAGAAKNKRGREFMIKFFNNLSMVQENIYASF